mmetsp:Transcript_3005/g.4608  ORF Transcript_3005/g.4608 Transcript_3005/m.4608 type:complete len:272 (-) Transcript_3005:57-872(-)
MGAVSSSESIIDEEIGVRGELLGEVRVILGLLLVKADVLEKSDGSSAHGSDGLLDGLTDAVGHEGHVLSKKLREASGNRSERELVLRSILGAAKMGGKKNLGAVVDEVLDSGDGGADAGVISDSLAIKGDVEVATDKGNLSVKLIFAKVGDRHLLLRGGVDPKSGAGGRGSSFHADFSVLLAHGKSSNRRHGTHGGVDGANHSRPGSSHRIASANVHHRSGSSHGAHSGENHDGGGDGEGSNDHFGHAEPGLLGGALGLEVDSGVGHRGED